MTTVTVIKNCVLMRKKQTSGFLQGQMFSMVCILTTNLPWWQVCTCSVHMWSERSGQTALLLACIMLKHREWSSVFQNTESQPTSYAHLRHQTEKIRQCLYICMHSHSQTHSVYFSTGSITQTYLTFQRIQMSLGKLCVKFGTVLPFKLGVT